MLASPSPVCAYRFSGFPLAHGLQQLSPNVAFRIAGGALSHVLLPLY
jgi:hypothetical protein